MTFCSSMAFSLRSWPMTSPSASRSPLAFVGHLQGDEPLAEQRLGQQPGADVGGDLVEVVGVDRQLDGRAVGARVDLADVADDDAAHLDVGGLLQLVAGGVGLQRILPATPTGSKK